MISGREHPAGVTLRRATVDDANRLMEWRNDPDAVRFSVSGTWIEKEEHERWLRAHLEDPATRLWIAEEAGQAVGQVRVETEGAVGVVSIAVAPGHRGRGLGSAILRAMLSEMGRDRTIQTLKATVHPDNVASLRVFERAGFRPRTGRTRGFLVLERPASI